jgi:hypothetical protein
MRLSILSICIRLVIIRYISAGAEPAPQLGEAKLKKKKFWEVKIRKSNKIWSKILIFF